MEKIISKAFWGIGHRDWTIMVFFFTQCSSLRKHPFLLALRRWGCFRRLAVQASSAGVNASLLLYDEFKAKKSSYRNINTI